MAAAVNIVLADALATPVNHTFIPLSKDANGVFWFEDQSQSNALGYWKISIDVKRTLPGAPGTQSKSDRVNRVKVALHEPTLEALGTADSGLTPPPSIAYITRATSEFILPERNSVQNRKDIRKMMALLLAETQVTNAVENLMTIY